MNRGRSNVYPTVTFWSEVRAIIDEIERANTVGQCRCKEALAVLGVGLRGVNKGGFVEHFLAVLAVDQHADVELANVAGSAEPEGKLGIGVSKNHEVIAAWRGRGVGTE